MAESDRDEGGKYTQTVTDEEILDAIDRVTGPAATASELADMLPIGRRATRERLLSLAEQDRVARKKVGGRAVIWWPVAETHDSLTEIPDDDPLFSAPTFSIGEPMDEDDIDDVLYGEVEQ